MRQTTEPRVNVPRRFQNDVSRPEMREIIERKEYAVKGEYGYFAAPSIMGGLPDWTKIPVALFTEREAESIRQSLLNIGFSADKYRHYRNVSLERFQSKGVLA